jgi:predicted Fe-Mo cluster-binding NifX family protein
MKVAVSSTGPDVDAQVDPRFGRCQYFVLVDSDSMNSESLENPNTMASGGAGIQSAQMVAERGAQVVLTGNCGPNAYQTLEAAGINVVVGVAGTVREAVDRYMSGELSPAGGPSVEEHYGSGMGPQQGPGAQRGGGGGGMRSGGGGFGRGGGGRGRRGGSGMGFFGRMIHGDPMPEAGTGVAREELNAQVAELKQQMQEIRRRISELEKEKGE